MCRQQPGQRLHTQLLSSVVLIKLCSSHTVAGPCSMASPQVAWTAPMMRSVFPLTHNIHQLTQKYVRVLFPFIRTHGVLECMMMTMHLSVQVCDAEFKGARASGGVARVTPLASPAGKTLTPQSCNPKVGPPQQTRQSVILVNLYRSTLYFSHRT